MNVTNHFETLAESACKGVGGDRFVVRLMPRSASRTGGSKGMGVAFAEYDHDGLMDVLVSTGNAATPSDGASGNYLVFNRCPEVDSSQTIGTDKRAKFRRSGGQRILRRRDAGLSGFKG
jgi:hypothetical protein